MIVKLSSISNPILKFEGTGKFVAFETQLIWNVIDPKTQQQKHAFTLVGSFRSRISITLKDLKIIPRLHFVKQEFKVKSSSIGDFTVNLLNKVLEIL